MKKPDLPRDEDSRLETLRSLGVLDTQPEERFDRLTRMAKRLFGVPIALVSLVDEKRQWFKSCVGLSASETPRDVSFCGHAILGDDLFIVPDASEDERFADNPLVIGEPQVRFYAGCPLRAPNGQKLGTLCIIDHEPRSLSKDDLEALIDLASMAEREFSALHLATTDELTELSNRRGFMALARHSLQFCTRERIPVSLVFMDLDHFKAINDRYGHAEGDRVLKEFARLLESTFRDSDLVARMGGDEFVALLLNHRGQDTDKSLARFGRALDRFNGAHDRGYTLSFSQGVVEYDPSRHSSVDALLEEGDALMYRTKKANRSLTSRV